MTTETLVKQYTAGAHVYFVIRNAAGQYLDSDYTFKALGSCSDPYWEATERILTAGASDSDYVATIDLADYAPGLAVVEGHVLAIKRVGGSPNLANDLVISQPAALVAQLGRAGQIDRQALAVLFSANVRTTSGVKFHARVKLLHDGETVPLKDLDPAATCTVTITRHGDYPQFDLDATDMGAVNDSHEFVVEYADPDFTADEGYGGEVTITADGVTVTCPIQFVIGGTA